MLYFLFACKTFVMHIGCIIAENDGLWLLRELYGTVTTILVKRDEDGGNGGQKSQSHALVGGIVNIYCKTWYITRFL